MLSQSCPTQKTVSEEESSGSDAGSEAGLEPETDRFGFILTNGSTAGSAGPPPELVRQREAKWINIIGQWDRILMKKTNKVKDQCQKGIPASLRAKCWPLLCGATDRMKLNGNLYKCLDSKPAQQSWVDVIERDLDRQFPFHEMFLSKDGHGQRGLFRVLKAYTQYQPEEGYCQAQGPVAAVLLMNMPAEEAFWCLVQISEEYLPGYYSPLLEGVLFDAAMLTWVLKRACPAAHKHLQHHGVEPLMFATDWLMCLFTRHLPFNTLLRVWDLFFCHGVRLLLQVAVVLVRRVLGRAEQRKQCQGQMETLERLRGVREQVQEDNDDSFITEVCSVQLSSKDLEKQTQKELEKWRKDRPSSTFDPRFRCHGYRMAWARARLSEQERDLRERQTGNLSVPLARSASTLSLSPSLLHKRWRKGGGGGGGTKVTRHVSMGAKEDWRSWTELRFKKVEGVQEEEDMVFSEERKKQSEPPKHTGQTDQKELLENPKDLDKTKNTPTEHEEEAADTVKDHVEQAKASEKRESQLQETEDSKRSSEQTEEQNNGQPEDHTVEIILHPPDHKWEEEELDSESQELEEKDAVKEREVPKSVPALDLEENRTDIEKGADSDANKEAERQGSVDPEKQLFQVEVEPEQSAENENEQQTQAETVEEVSETTTEGSSPGSESAPTVEVAKVETSTPQQQQLEITETDNGLKEDAIEGKYQSNESFPITDVTKESHTLTEAETDKLAPTQDRVQENADTQDYSEVEIKVQIDSELDRQSKMDAEIFPPECVQSKEGIDVAADTKAEGEMSVSDDLTESSEALSQSSEEEEGDTVASRPTQEEDLHVTAHSETCVDNDQTQAKETLTETQTNEEMNEPIAPPQKEEMSPEAQETNPTAEPDGKVSLEEISISEELPAEAKIQVMVPVVEDESTENVEVSTSKENEILISHLQTVSPITECSPQDQVKDSHLAKEHSEPISNWQEPGYRSSKPCGDFRVRKSSSSRGSRSAHRLSEDLFTVPQKTDLSQSIPDHPEVQHTESQSNPVAVNPTQGPPDATPEVTGNTARQQSKGFGLFRRLRGEQPKKVKVRVPKILIQDFSDMKATGKPAEGDGEEKLSSRERRRRRREQERTEKEQEKMVKKREKELEKERRKPPQTRGKSFQVQREKGSNETKTASQTFKYTVSAESYF